MHAPTALPNTAHARVDMGSSAGAFMAAVMVDRLPSWVVTWVLGHGPSCAHSVGSVWVLHGLLRILKVYAWLSSSRLCYGLFWQYEQLR